MAFPRTLALVLALSVAPAWAGPDFAPLIPIEAGGVGPDLALPAPIPSSEEVLSPVSPESEQAPTPQLAAPVVLLPPAQTRTAPPRAETLTDAPDRGLALPSFQPVPKKDMAQVEIETTTNVVAPIQGELAIILSHGRFRPSQLRVPFGAPVTLLFTTTGTKPAALVIEKLNVQEWVTNRANASLDENQFSEINRELSSSRLTEIRIEPERGIYKFHDALTGASGEIMVE